VSDPRLDEDQPRERVSVRDYLETVRAADRESYKLVAISVLIGVGVFWHERDRRYAEVALEREKALKIKEEADKAALGLAREIQTYKDEKANELRSQIERERGSYATHIELEAAVSKIGVQLQPVTEFVVASGGRTLGISNLWGYVLGGITAAALLYGALHH
jgi:hypothetical protein